MGTPFAVGPWHVIVIPELSGGEEQDFLESGASLAYIVSLDSLDYGVSSSLKNQETKFKSLIVSNYNSFKNM